MKPYKKKDKKKFTKEVYTSSENVVLTTKYSIEFIFVKQNKSFVWLVMVNSKVCVLYEKTTYT